MKTKAQLINEAEMLEKHASRRGSSGTDDRIKAAQLREEATATPAPAPVKHTKLPLQIGHANLTGPDDGTRFNANMIYDANGDGVCLVYGLPQNTSLAEIEKSKHPSTIKGLEFARLIVSAVNGRDALLSALEGLLAATVKYEHVRHTGSRREIAPVEETYHDALSAARAAIAEATKGEE